jgi:CRP-like cAMP-binding protein
VEGDVAEIRNHLLCELPLGIRAIVTAEMTELTLRPGDVLQRQGDPVLRCIFIETGVVAQFRLLDDGARVEASLVGREGLVGIGAGATAFTEAQVQAGGSGLAVDADRLRLLAARYPPLADVLTRYGAYLVDEARMNAVCNAAHAMEQRLAKWLLRFHDRSDGPSLVFTQEFASEMLGVQRTSLTAAMGRLADQGLLVTGRGGVRLRDLEGLRAVACECYRNVEERLPEMGLPEAAERGACPAA